MISLTRHRFARSVGNLGVATCYDLRFPELFTSLREAGAQILLVPSAFMPTTGKAHWEVLLRARAIENQCYVVAAAQYGQHNPKRASYGHALIVDPWGEVLQVGLHCRLRYGATDSLVSEFAGPWGGWERCGRGRCRFRATRFHPYGYAD